VLAQLAAIVVAKTPPPSTVPDDQVTPGVWGFVITAAVAVAVVLLIIDMTRRIRRVRYREQVLADIAAEQAVDGAAEGDRPAS
jgi:O-antigen/teichoic acid export membrane protein